MHLLSRTLPAAIALLLLTSCAQISITGPCDVQSDSSITLDVEWTTEVAAPPAASGARAPTAVTSVVTKLNGATSGHPFRIRTQAVNESVTLMMEVPSTWTETAVSATVNGVPATPVGSDDPAYCGDTLGLPRDGYVRRFYLITPAAPLVADATGTFQITYATATIADGVYHPAVFFSVEPETESSCVPMTSFHRVTAGTLKFVNFDLSSSFNADTVVNGTDVLQDALVTLTNGSETARLAFATESFLLGDISGLPDDGLLTPERYALQTDGIGSFELPECLPDMQLGWSEGSDGNNTWLQQVEGDALVVDVPDAHYAELLLYVTAGVGDFGAEGSNPDTLMRAMHVEMTYEDASTTEVATLLPLLGLPVTIPPALPDTPDLVPSFTMSLGTLVGADGAAESVFPLPAGIAAMLVTPDSSKRLVSITITPFLPAVSALPEGPAVTTNGPRSEAAIEPVKMAVYGAAGMQLVPNLSVEKSLLTPEPYLIGDAVTYRITVTNSGNAPSTAVTVTDTLEAALAFVSAAASDGTCNEAGGVVTCSLGEIAPGASETVDIVAAIAAVGPFSNTAQASMAGGEADTSDNAATVAAVALGVPNLAVTKTVETPGPYQAGTEVTYRITVTNDGTADSTAVTVTDDLPTNLAFVSANASDGSCNEAGDTVTCSLGVIAAGASETVDIVARINAPGVVTNTGEASMEGGEADPSDNAATATITAQGAAFTGIPTLSEWALLLLASMLGLIAVLRARS